MKPALRFEIFRRDQFTCRYCGRKSPEAILEVDHILPRAVGGIDEPDNLATSCYECNRGKGARLLTASIDELNLHEKTVLIAEQELQISEYNYWRGRQKTREDTELDQLELIWKERWDSTYTWQRTEVRTFLRSLGYAELVDILEIVAEKTVKQSGKTWAESGWKFFCGICWTRVKNRNS